MSEESVSTAVLERISSIEHGMYRRLARMRTAPSEAAVEDYFEEIKLDIQELRKIVEVALVKAKKIEKEHVMIIKWLKRHDRQIEKIDAAIEKQNLVIKELKLKAKAV